MAKDLNPSNEPAAARSGVPNPAAAPQFQLDESKVSTGYANFCRLTETPEEVILDFGLNPGPLGNPKNLVKITDRIVMNYLCAKRLLLVLNASVRRHEEAFGPLEIDLQKRLAAVHGKPAGE